MSTIQFEAAPLPALGQSNSDTPRKKRKRAPAQGAADDCFTCLNRRTKCDRRRPYCSQCLDGGQDCAGYKTQLTWGVGVASRGKLRGLSLPVAGTTKTPNDHPTSPSKTKKRTNVHQNTTNSTPSPRTKVATVVNQQTNRNDGPTFRISVPTPSFPNTSTHETQALQPQIGRGSSSPGTAHSVQTNINPILLNSYNPTSQASSLPTTFSQSVNTSAPYDKNMPMHLSPYRTPSPMNQYFQSYPSQHQMPPTPTSHAYHVINEPLVHAQSNYRHVPHTPYSMQHEYINQAVYTPQSYVSEFILPSHTSPLADDAEEIKREPINDGYGSDILSTSSASLPMDHGLSMALSGVGAIGKSPRMQYLIQYYAEVISPVIVAFDSPSNPLRNQILAYAARSESLQHAIAALSASNIRQRREDGTLSTGKTPGARRSSYMHQNLITDAWDPENEALTIQDRRREESLHKFSAIKMLNQQLADPVARKDDSVLATLLMLCLFHICDSGIARFQTQFAGVRKLLALRGHNYKGSNGDTKWMTRIFAFFDSVAATVNDREGQIGGPFVDVAAYADGEWPYETLSGVDSRLFKPMSRLGRLNVLSQGLETESNPTIVSRPLPLMSNFTGRQESDYRTFDGNGWMRIVSDENLFNLKTASSTVQERFWREWKEVRQDLQMWSFDNSRFSGSDSSQPFLTEEQRYDSRMISESFRYSALLYTERLADPQLPSSDPKIQDWVQKSLYHIKQVRADVYLLWCLFITGAECGDEEERNVIRQRCLDIQKDSGFMNNSSCLALLEKLWKGSKTNQTKAKASNFKFRDVMLAESNDGEWIVV